MAKNKKVEIYLLDKEGKAEELNFEDLETADKEDKILWIHFDYSSPQAIDWITNKSNIDSIAIDALLTEETRPRTTILDDSLLIALRGVNLEPKSKPEDMISIRLFITPTLIISTRKRDLLTIKEIADNLKKGVGPKSSSEFLIELTYRIIERMEDIIDNIEDRADQLEENIINSSDLKYRNEILAIRRESIVLRRYLFPQKEAMNKLYHDKITWINEYERIELREINDQLIRHIEELDTIKDKVTLIQEELSNMLSDQMNKKMYMLSIISAIFLPLTFLTGLLGINIDGIPGAKNENAFLIFCVMLIVVVSIQYVIFKKKKWL
ncbi:MAG: zinc transporter ZntB [Aliarcobacter sp.]|jgi:zinc transporter|nr:zinc transporter ZntB [Aliarcobacter sp.]MDX9959886.1 zinc transporter ZntB [Aliarcobacter sp.]